MRAGTDADHPGPLVTASDIERDARSAEQARGGLGDLLQRALGIARRVGDGAEDFGAAGLTIAVSTQFAQEPGVFHRAGGLLRDRFVALGQTRLEPLFKLGNPAPEIGHHVLGKRGHSLKSILPRAWWRRLKYQHTRPGCRFIWRAGRQCHLPLKTGQCLIIPPRTHLCQRHPGVFPRPGVPQRANAQVPDLETSVSLLVMNSNSTGTPSLVFAMPRRMAGMMSSGFVTRSPWPPKARAIAA